MYPYQKGVKRVRETLMRAVFYIPFLDVTFTSRKPYGRAVGGVPFRTAKSP